MKADITEDNFFVYAKKSYKVPHFVEQEFYYDLKRIKYIKRLFQQYRNSGTIKERLILNHMILLYNVFEPIACTKILFYKFKPADYSTLKTFLLYLGHMPEIIYGINGTIIESNDIMIEENIANTLRKIL